MGKLLTCVTFYPPQTEVRHCYCYRYSAQWTADHFIHIKAMRKVEPKPIHRDLTIVERQLCPIEDRFVFPSQVREVRAQLKEIMESQKMSLVR